MISREEIIGIQTEKSFLQEEKKANEIVFSLFVFFTIEEKIAWIDYFLSLTNWAGQFSVYFDGAF